MPATASTRRPSYTEREPPWRLVTLEDYVPEHLKDAAAAILDPLRGKVTLRVVTMGLDDKPACDGSMTCSCESCAKDRASRVAVGAGPAEFKPRPARRAA